MSSSSKDETSCDALNILSFLLYFIDLRHLIILVAWMKHVGVAVLTLSLSKMRYFDLKHHFLNEGKVRLFYSVTKKIAGCVIFVFVKHDLKESVEV